MTVLARILSAKAREVEALVAQGPLAPGRPPRDVRKALRRAPGDALRLVCEIKFKSPSAGELSRALGVEARATVYAEEGAAMVSVLCDEPFFDGGWGHLTRARAAMEDAGHEARVLAKEFVIDVAQVARARSAGADAILLIVRIAPPDKLAELARAAWGAGLEPLFEVVDERELDTAMACGARLVGVNARDLDTLVMDADRAARVLAKIPEGVVALHLSGIKTPDAIAAVARGRAHAALLGEALMREHDPRPLLRSLVSAAKRV